MLLVAVVYYTFRIKVTLQKQDLLVLLTTLTDMLFIIMFCNTFRHRTYFQGYCRRFQNSSLFVGIMLNTCGWVHNNLGSLWTKITLSREKYQRLNGNQQM